MKIGKLLSIEEVFDVDETSLGIMGYATCGNGIFDIFYDGYKIKTSEKTYFILIKNGQCCCENWGYFSSEDDFENYIGKEILSVELTNMALNKIKVEETYADDDQIQFVDFKFLDGSVLQFAVYNAHNGYYGHQILVLQDDKVILQDCI